MEILRRSTRGQRFWEILHCNNNLGITHNFQLDSTEGIADTVSLLLSGNYGTDRSPLLFFECLYTIPGNSPEDLRKLFRPRTNGFERYLHRPGLEYITAILNNHPFLQLVIDKHNL